MKTYNHSFQISGMIFVILFSKRSLKQQHYTKKKKRYMLYFKNVESRRKEL